MASGYCDAGKALIFLVGARAAGKTTLGRLFARDVSCRFMDTDHVLAEKWGCSVAEFVNREGWEAFRLEERAALREVSEKGVRTVVATGGGMVLDPGNRTFMREHGVVFYLAASAATLAARLRQEANMAQRPSLTGGDTAGEMGAVLAARHALYLECAHHVLDATAEISLLCAEMRRLSGWGSSRQFGECLDMGAGEG